MVSRGSANSFKNYSKIKPNSGKVWKIFKCLGSKFRGSGFRVKKMS